MKKCDCAKPMTNAGGLCCRCGGSVYAGGAVGGVVNPVAAMATIGDNGHIRLPLENVTPQDLTLNIGLAEEPAKPGAFQKIMVDMSDNDRQRLNEELAALTRQGQAIMLPDRKPAILPGRYAYQITSGDNCIVVTFQTREELEEFMNRQAKTKPEQSHA